MIPINKLRLFDKARWISAVAAAYTVAAGTVCLAGWWLNNDRLSDWWQTGIVIKANTCIATILAGVAIGLTLLHPRARKLAGFSALLVALLGGATLFEHLTDINLGIDTLLFDEPPGAPATVAPGRMGPPASISFLIIGIALLLLHGNRVARKAAVGLGLFVLGVSALSLTGYLYNAQSMYSVPQLTGIAAQTATILLALAIGVIAAAPDLEPTKTFLGDSSAGVLARRVIPIAVLVPLALGWMRLEGFRAGIYDQPFGAALRTLAEMFILGALLWWCIKAIRLREQRQLEAEHQRQLSENRLALILENLTDGFVTLDSNYRFTYVNACAERVVEQSRTRLLHRVAWDVFPELVGTPLHREILRVAQEGVAGEVDHTGLGSNSSHRHFRNRIYPASDGGVSIYFQDVTSRVAAENALRLADQQKDEFLATLAHELRNPLAPISNAAALLTTPGATSAMLHSSAEIIGRQVKHMARLLEDLLDISRVSRNRLELRKECLMLANIIESAIEASRPAIDTGQHELTVALPREAVYLNGDLTRLAQVFSNLLNNAAKYTPTGGVIAITASIEGDDIFISISDNGIGIDADALPHIFDMFTQASPDSPSTNQGLGIGLALARSIAQRHDGDIEARSAGKNLGSEFIVRLPMLETGAIPERPESTKNEAISNCLRLLVVDDQRDSADSLVRLLQVLGHDARATYSGHGALSDAEAFQPDAIFLDIGLPDLDGLEVCRRLRANASMLNLFIVAMTGWGQADDKQQTQSAGFNIHLTKPVSADDLFALLHDINAKK